MSEIKELQKNCCLCPRNCGIDRLAGQKGFCGVTAEIMVARAALHMWEEPCISGKEGSGAVFFSGCSLGCVFCQNRAIARGQSGKMITVERLAEIFLDLQRQKANNINLVTAGHFLVQVREALILAKKQGLTIPVVYNSSGYEKAEMLQLLDGLVDIYLPDFKYMESDLAGKYSHAKDYPEIAREALAEMVRQAGTPEFDDRGMMKKGVIVRHLLLPGCRKDAMAVIDFLCRALPADKILFSLMSQYTPCYKAVGDQKIGRRVTTFEAESVREYAVSRGLSGFSQDRSSATGEYIPAFDLTGVVRRG